MASATSAQVESSFSSLLSEDKLTIFRKLRGSSRKNARLVCADWYTLVSQVSKPKCILSYNNAGSLELSKKFLSPAIGILKVAHFNTKIPIYSSSRIKLPLAVGLILGPQVSLENVFKLLRYYTRSCEMLSLDYLCFASFRSSQMKEHFKLANIKQLSISLKCQNEAEFKFRHDQDKHLLAMGQFLKSCPLPNLQVLELDVGTLQTGNVASEQLAHRRFYDTYFPEFLGNYGQQIQFLRVSAGKLILGFDLIMDSLYYLVNLQELKFQFNEYPEAAVQNFERTFSELLVLNQDTLVYVTKFFAPASRSIEWLCTSTVPNMKFLAVEFHRNDGEITRLLTTDNTLESVRELHVPIVDDDHVWRNGVIEWMIQCLPHLEKLTLDIKSHMEFRLEDFLKMIHQHPKVKIIDYDGSYFWSYERPDLIEGLSNETTQVHVCCDKELGTRILISR